MSSLSQSTKPTNNLANKETENVSKHNLTADQVTSQKLHKQNHARSLPSFAAQPNQPQSSAWSRRTSQVTNIMPTPPYASSNASAFDAVHQRRHFHFTYLSHNKPHAFTSSWRPVQPSCGRWSWCADHARSDPSSDGDHGGSCNQIRGWWRERVWR